MWKLTLFGAAVISLLVILVPSGPTLSSEPVAAAAAAADEDPVDAAIADPPATGLLVTRVVAGSAAEGAGVKPGDILTAYGGTPTPDLQAINYAKDSFMGEGPVEVVVKRGEQDVTFSLPTGSMGVILVAVVKGEGREPLPASTGAKLDFSRLGKEDRDHWFVILAEEERVGMARITERIVGTRLFVMSEEIYDAGAGLQDHEVTSVASATTPPMASVTYYRDRMNDWVRFGLPGDRHDWHTVTRGAGSEDERLVVPITGDTIPVYIVETLASLMPREKGACFRFLPLNEGSGQVGLAGALVCLGEKEVEANGKKVKAFGYEWRQRGGTTNGTFWMDANHLIVLADYGVVRAVATTREDALADQPAAIRARLER